MNNILSKILLASFILFSITWLRAFILSGLRREAFFASSEGLIAGLIFRVFLAIGIGSILVCVFSPKYMRWSSITLPYWIRWIGLVFFISGYCLLFWALAYLKKGFSASLIIKESHVLVITGPYRLVQHPMYTAFVIIWISFFVISANWLIGLSGILAYSVIIIFRTPKEERMLFERFGEKYANYRTRTGRYLPRKDTFLGVKRQP